MNRTTRDKLLSDAASWASDRDRLRERSHKRAWVLTWILATVVVIEGLALLALAPLKTVVPYTILVDRQTGFTTALDPARPARLGTDEALTRSLLVQYVAAREGFSIGSVRGDYRKVMSWSSGPARDSYGRVMAQSSAESPFMLYPRSTTLEVQPKSVSSLSDGSALVRFDVLRSDQDGRTSAAVPYAAVIRYRFTPRAMTLEERLINPLGFEVSRYRRDAEVLSASAPASSAPNLLDAAAQTGSPL